MSRMMRRCGVRAIPCWTHRVPREVAEKVLGREHYILQFPTVVAGERVPSDCFHGIAPD